MTEQDRNQRGPWYLLTGVIVGLVFGLIYSWFIQPVQYQDTPPASLRSDYKEQYRLMIATAYAANGDLVRAQERLKLLKDDDSARELIEQAQRILASEGNLEDARSLGLLATALELGLKTVAQPTLETTQSPDLPATETTLP